MNTSSSFRQHHTYKRQPCDDHHHSPLAIVASCSSSSYAVVTRYFQDINTDDGHHRFFFASITITFNIVTCCTPHDDCPICFRCCCSFALSSNWEAPGAEGFAAAEGPSAGLSVSGPEPGIIQESSDTLTTLKYNLNQSKGSNWKDFDSRIVAGHPVGVATLYCKLKKEVGDAQQSLDVSV